MSDQVIQIKAQMYDLIVQSQALDNQKIQIQNKINALVSEMQILQRPPSPHPDSGSK